MHQVIEFGKHDIAVATGCAGGNATSAGSIGGDAGQGTVQSVDNHIFDRSSSTGGEGTGGNCGNAVGGTAGIQRAEGVDHPLGAQ